MVMNYLSFQIIIFSLVFSASIRSNLNNDFRERISYEKFVSIVNKGTQISYLNDVLNHHEIYIHSIALQKIIDSPKNGTSDPNESSNVYSQNEIFIEFAGLPRKFIALHYSRALKYLPNPYLDLRLIGSVGLDLFFIKELPTIPLGLQLRTGDPYKNGFCMELGVNMVIGDTNNVENYWNIHKANYIDFPLHCGLVYESESFLFKNTFGYVLRNGGLDPWTIGLSFGYRF